MESIIAIMILLVIGSFASMLAKKWKIPYTILLFCIWLFLVPLSSFPWFSLIKGFVLSPTILLYVFLPILLFDAWYRISLHDLYREWWHIGILATWGIVLSTVLLVLLLYGIWSLFGIVPSVLYLALVAVIISATDPVAVLALCKELGVPKRLYLLFEWESMLNDATAVAIFFVILGLFVQGWSLGFDDGLRWLLTFVSMMLWGVMIGLGSGFVFSKWLQWIKHQESAEIAITMVMAHGTFVMTEMLNHLMRESSFPWLQSSAVIATMVAWLVMGNYGKAKLSLHVEATMDKIWSFSSFVTNALLFLLLGLSLARLDYDVVRYRYVIATVIALTVVVRPCVVFVCRFFSQRLTSHLYPIPRDWALLLSRWDLKGAIAITLVFLTPQDLVVPGRSLTVTPYSMLLAIVLCCVVFSLLVKWLTMLPMMRMLWLDRLSDFDRFSRLEAQLSIYHTIVQKIGRMKTDMHTRPQDYEYLLSLYQTRIDEAKLALECLVTQQWSDFVKRALALHALGVEEAYVQEMYQFHEIDEPLYYFLLTKIHRQQARLIHNEDQLQSGQSHAFFSWWQWSWIRRLTRRFEYRDLRDDERMYRVQRARFVVTGKVVRYFREHQRHDCALDPSLYDEIIQQYNTFHRKAWDAIARLVERDTQWRLSHINHILLAKHLVKIEMSMVDHMYRNHTISERVYHDFVTLMDTQVDGEGVILV